MYSCFLFIFIRIFLIKRNCSKGSIVLFHEYIPDYITQERCQVIRDNDEGVCNILFAENGHI